MRGTAIALLCLACAPARTPVPAPPVPVAIRPPAPAWPRSLLAGEGDGPALFSRSDADAEPLAWIASGVELRVRGAVHDGRVQARVEGPLRVRGWIPLDRLDAYVVQRGRVAGSALFVMPGDRVRLVAVDGAQATIEARAALGRPDAPPIAPMRGTFALAQLGGDDAGGGEGSTPGRSVELGGAVSIFDRPGGRELVRLPAVDPPWSADVLRERGDWLGVRMGIGPFLVGYVRRAAIRSSAHKQEVLDPWGNSRAPEHTPVADPWGSPPEPADDGLPPMLSAARVRPLLRVRAGSRVRVEGRTMAIFGVEGLAVELDRRGDDVLVLAAIGPDIAVRGVMSAADLTLLPSARPAVPAQQEEDSSEVGE